MARRVHAVSRSRPRSHVERGSLLAERLREKHKRERKGHHDRSVESSVACINRRERRAVRTWLHRYTDV